MIIGKSFFDAYHHPYLPASSTSYKEKRYLKKDKKKFGLRN
jgi:hypothetical protein